MNRRVNNPVIFIIILYLSHSVYIELDFSLDIAVSLANTLNRTKVLEAKLCVNTKALEEADTKYAEEVATAKLAATQAVKEVKERAIKAEKALAEVT
jgi:hypothetical protein